MIWKYKCKNILWNGAFNFGWRFEVVGFCGLKPEKEHNKI